MKAICIVLDKENLKECAVGAQLFYGLNGDKLSVETVLEGSEGGKKLSPKAVGRWLSHRAVWAACLMLPSDDDRFFIFEDGLKLPTDWKAYLEQALKSADDFDLVYAGAFFIDGTARLEAGLNEHWSRCAYGYAVHRRELLSLMQAFDEARCCIPVDVALMSYASAKLDNVYTILPRAKIE